jgi:DNA-binding NtrC family response regulator
VSHADDVSQVCLAGPRLSRDWTLIQALLDRQVVTLVSRVEVLSEGLFLGTVRVLVLDGVEAGGVSLRILPALRSRCPSLCVVLVDGGLDQRQLATAFREGVRDYFPEPVDVHLLAERVAVLGGGPPA